jgi:hypothetical protein
MHPVPVEAVNSSNVTLIPGFHSFGSNYSGYDVSLDHPLHTKWHRANGSPRSWADVKTAGRLKCAR